jgi:hypothetical protein
MNAGARRLGWGCGGLFDMIDLADLEIGRRVWVVGNLTGLGQVVLSEWCTLISVPEADEERNSERVNHRSWSTLVCCCCCVTSNLSNDKTDHNMRNVCFGENIGNHLRIPHSAPI